MYVHECKFALAVETLSTVLPAIIASSALLVSKYSSKVFEANARPA